VGSWRHGSHQENNLIAFINTYQVCHDNLNFS
jgi:hypothetical protein